MIGKARLLEGGGLCCFLCSALGCCTDSAVRGAQVIPGTGMSRTVLLRCGCVTGEQLFFGRQPQCEGLFARRIAIDVLECERIGVRDGYPSLCETFIQFGIELVDQLFPGLCRKLVLLERVEEAYGVVACILGRVDLDIITFADRCQFGIQPLDGAAVFRIRGGQPELIGVM